MSVTIKQIAALANVSRGTVDRVLNNRPGVNPDTREKVLRIAKELHYQPNFLAKALVNSKENIKLGVILTPDYNPFIHEIIKGIEDHPGASGRKCKWYGSISSGPPEDCICPE